MNRCAYTATGTQDQNEIAAADVPAEVSNVNHPHWLNLSPHVNLQVAAKLPTAAQTHPNSCGVRQR